MHSITDDMPYIFVVRASVVYSSFIAMDVHTIEVVDNFTYLGSTMSSSLSLEVELNIKLQ